MADDLKTYTSDATCPCGAAGDCNCPNCPCPKVSIPRRAAEPALGSSSATTPEVTVPRLKAPKLTEQQKTDLLNDYDVYMDKADTKEAKLTAKPRPKAKQTQALSYQNKTKTLVYEPPLVLVQPSQSQSYSPSYSSVPVQPSQYGGSAGGNLYAPPTVTYYSQPMQAQAAPSYGSAGGVPQQTYGSSGGVPASGYTAYYAPAPAPVQTYVTQQPYINQPSYGSSQVYVNAAPAPRAVFTPFGGFFRGGSAGRMICSGGQCYIR